MAVKLMKHKMREAIRYLYTVVVITIKTNLLSFSVFSTFFLDKKSGAIPPQAGQGDSMRHFSKAYHFR